MELLPDGRMVLDGNDIVGVRSLIYAKTRMVVSIHATTDPYISEFVTVWEALTGDDFMAGNVEGFSGPAS